MAANGLGTLTLDLVAKISGFTGPLSAAERELKKTTDRMNRMAHDLGEGIGKSLRSAAGHFLAFAGVSVSIAAVSGAIKGAIDQADKLNDFSIRLGASAEALSGWAYAAKQTGTDIDALGVGFKKLQASMADALDPKSAKGQLFAALGVSVTDATGKLKTLEEIVPQIATAFKGLNDDALQTKVAMDLFGKSGTDLIEFLELGGTGLTEMQTRARELGVVFSDETLKAADAFNDGLSDLKSVADGMATQLAAEMLPALNDFITATVDWWREGDNAKGVMDALRASVELSGTVISGAGEILSSFNSLLGGTSSFAAGAASDIQRLCGDVKVFTEIAASAVDFLSASIQSSEEKANAARARLSKAASSSAGWAGVNSSVSTKQNIRDPRFTGLQTEITDADYRRNTTAAVRSVYGGSAGGSRRTPSRRGGGRSHDSTPKLTDEQKEAERLKQSYDRLMESMAERTFMLGKEGEAAKLSWDLQHGELTKLTQAQKDAAMAAAQAYDAAVAKDKQRQAEADALARADESAKRMLESLREEIDMLGMSNSQQEIYNNLKSAGVEANSEYGQSIIALTEQAQKMRDMRGLADEAGQAFGNLFYNIASGSMSAKDAFKEFMAQLTSMILKFIAQKLAEKMADSIMKIASSTGNTASYSGGQGGSIWGDLLGAFAGGRASGGPVSANTLYRVNERGPELLTVSGKDYLMMGRQPGNVTPNHQIGGGSGVTQVINNNYAAPTDPRTRQQVAKDVGYQTRRAIARTA